MAVLGEELVEQAPELLAFARIQPGCNGGPSGHPVSEVGAQRSAVPRQLQHLDPAVGPRDTFDEAQLSQPVREPGDVRCVAAEMVGEATHGRRLLEPEHRSGLQGVSPSSATTAAKSALARSVT
ncbi:MAG: hypothetical protein WKF73_19180 [Nocardioidaceae bacterium]